MVRLLFSACLLAALPLAGCASVKDAPSLAPREAEGIDPRLPVPDRSAALPADPELSSALGALRERALRAAREAEPAIAAARAASLRAGARESESWIAAQQAISAAVGARAAFTTALGDLDRLIALRIRGRERLVPQDLAAAEAVVEELGVIDRRQSAVLAAASAALR
jgi:hypothetical protein